MKKTSILIILCLTNFLISCNSGESTEAVNVPSQPPNTPNEPTTPTDSSIQTQLQNLLDNQIANSNTPGIVLSVVDNGQSFSLASGIKDSQNAIAIEVNDSLRIASITKLFVATVVVKLVEQGSLELDALMVDYLDSQLIDTIDNYDQVTVRQLLNMTSGIVDYTQIDGFNDAIDDDPTRVWQQAQVLAYIHNLPANFTPGSNWAYSNTNYVLLDLIVGAVSNSSLAEVLRLEIFTPLAMESTYLEFAEGRAANGSQLSVQGYEGNDNVTLINDGIGFGDGGIVSTVADLAVFLDALYHQKTLLSQSSLDDMLNQVMGQQYGLGTEIRVTTSGPAWGHNGASSGFSGDLLYFPDNKRAVALLSNQADSNILDEVTNQVINILQ